MAITPTGAIYKALSFDNVSSRNYGVYITGQAVYNAPTRDVEMISIPGRNGAFALDKGRFENIEVSYPAGIFADNETDFAEAISNFRNFLCSRNGYVRLSDEYNPNEYRMAIYKSGLEVTPAQLKAGEFEIVFDCKPQRWLTSGETEITVSSGDTVTNPTLFDASPLLEVEGYGTINLNNYEIDIANGELGNVAILDPYYGNLSFTNYSPINAQKSLGKLTDDIKALFNQNDTFTVPSFTVKLINLQDKSDSTNITALTKVSDSLSGASTSVASGSEAYRYNVTVNMPSISIGVYTTQSVSLVNVTTLTATRSNGTSVTETLTTEFQYFIPNKTLYIKAMFASGSILITKKYPQGVETQIGAIIGYSSVSQLGNPTYIDCDLGEAYMIKNGTYVGLNSYIDLGSELPALAPGSNTITFDNTVTELKIIPRWWKV